MKWTIFSLNLRKVYLVQWPGGTTRRRKTVDPTGQERRGYTYLTASKTSRMLHLEPTH